MNFFLHCPLNNDTTEQMVASWQTREQKGPIYLPSLRGKGGWGTPARWTPIQESGTPAPWTSAHGTRIQEGLSILWSTHPLHIRDPRDPIEELTDEPRTGNQPRTLLQINQEEEYLVELEGDDDAEAEREPEGRVEQEEGLPPALAPVRGKPRAPPPRASASAAAAPGLRPRRRPPRSC